MPNATFWKSFGVYTVLTMACAAGWHLGLFPGVYAAANMRREPLIHLGMFSVLIQAAIVSWLYPRVRGNGAPLAEGAKFGLLIGLLIGSYGVLAEAGKFDVGPLGQWLVYEGTYFLLQFTLVGAVLGWVHGRPARDA